MWFVARATDAPWPPADADLRAAEPNIRNGLYDQLEAFYRHFENDAPSQVARSKISKAHSGRPDCQHRIRCASTAARLWLAVKDVEGLTPVW